MKLKLKLKSRFVIPVLIAIGFILFLNFGTKTVKPGDNKESSNAATAMTDEHNHAIPNFDLDSFQNVEKVKLPPEMQTNISLLENNIAREADKSQKIADLESLGRAWIKAKRQAIGAYYLGASAKLENSEKKLNFAANLFVEEIEKEEPVMEGMRFWMLGQMIELYQASLAINPLNDTIKLDLATTYLNANDAMKGVEQLLDVVKRDSTHIPANIMLGKMAIQSGQLDKAIERGRTILRINPQSIDAHLFMGEAYKQMGEKEKAIQLFMGAKELMNNPEFSKDIDEYIASF